MSVVLVCMVSKSPTAGKLLWLCRVAPTNIVWITFACTVLSGSTYLILLVLNPARQAISSFLCWFYTCEFGCCC